MVVWESGYWFLAASRFVCYLDSDTHWRFFLLLSSLHEAKELRALLQHHYRSARFGLIITMHTSVTITAHESVHSRAATEAHDAHGLFSCILTLPRIA